MNITTAQAIIESLIKNKKSELESLELALSILNTTFEPDLTAIATAQAEADELRNKVADAEVEKNNLVAQHAEEVEKINTEKVEADIAHEEEKSVLQKQVDDLTVEVERLKLVAEVPMKETMESDLVIYN